MNMFKLTFVYIKQIYEYVVNNNLQLDKGTYMAAVVGMITIYGIYLTLHQMVVSCIRDNSLLGINLSRFYISKHAWWDKRFVGRVTVCIIVVVTLIKPYLNVFGKNHDDGEISVLIFFWYFLVVFFFGASTVLIYQGYRCIKRLEQRADYVLAREIEDVFMKNCASYRGKAASIDLLIEDIEDLVYRKERDDGYKQSRYYVNIFMRIFEKYIAKKAKEIEDIQIKKVVCKNQVGFKYNEGVEYDFLYGLISGQYLAVDDDLCNCMTGILFNLIELNVRRAKLEKEDDVFGSKVLWNSQPYRLIIQLFESSNMETRSKMLNMLNERLEKANEELGVLYKECIRVILQKEFDRAVVGEREASEFCDMLQESRMKDKCNNRIADMIASYMCECKKDVPLPLIEVLSEENCQYILMYVFAFYSIKKSKIDWKYIQIETLRGLWEKIDEDNIEFEHVMVRLKKSDCLRGISEQWGKVFKHYINHPLNSSLIEQVVEEPFFAPFYILMLKLCVMRQHFYATTGDVSAELQNMIIRELIKHEEVMKDPYMKDFMSYVQFNNVYDFSNADLNLSDSLRFLLLVNAEIETIFYSVNWSSYKYTKGLGEYFLIKSQEKTKRMKEANEIIWKAFITFDGSQEAYIEMLERECKICNYPLNYVQKERMKDYLIEQIRNKR